MRLNPVDILANWYNDETLPWSAQKAVNCLAETAEVGGTRSVAKTKGLPGLTLLANLETGAPIRGAEDVEGTLFVVSGTSLFQINPDNSFTNRGNIPGVSLVSMAHNKQGGTTAANELVIANGLSGYVYNTDTTVLSQITDDAFPGATTFDYVDGYISFTDPEGRFWGHSALNQATQYSSIDRYDAESAPDKIVSHIVSHREVMVFGTRTTEFFRNTGAATGTFQRVDGTEMEVGIAAPLARARLDNTVYWLGSDGLVYRLAGHSPQRVSTRPIEQAISRFNLDNAFAHTWEDRGHQIFYLTFPDGLTFGYDVATSLWHARETFGLERWGVNTTTRWNGLWVAGDYSNGKLYRLNWDDFTEDGRPLVMECQPGVTHADGNDVLCPYVELFMDTGQSPNPADLDPLQIFGDAPNTLSAVPYSYDYSAAGGFGIYTYAITGGSIPGGLVLSPSGVLSGVATSNGSFSFTVTVTDSLGNTASLNDTIAVSFTSNAIIAESANNLEIRSGGNNTFPLLQTLITPNITTGSCVITSSDGTFLAFTQNAAERIALYKKNSLGSYILVPAAFDVQPSAVRQIDMTSDGLYLAVVDGTQLRIYKRNTTTDVYATIHTQTDVNFGVDLKWSPNGRYLAVAASLGHVLLRTGDTFSEISNPSGNAVARGFAWNPSSTAYVQKSNGALRVYSVTDTLVSQLTSISETGIGRCRWTRDESTVFVSSNTASPAGIFLRIYSWNGTTLTRLADPVQLPSPAVSIENIDLSSDGRVLMVGAAAGLAIVGFYAVSGSTLSLIPGTTPVINGMFNRFAVSSDHWGQ